MLTVTVAIADAVALIDYILNGEATGLNLDLADMDGDGAIGIADVADLVDLITSNTPAED